MVASLLVAATGMAGSCWHLDAAEARLVRDKLTGRIALTAGKPSLAQIAYAGHTLGAARVLGVDVAATPTGMPYVRADDLVATYLPRTDHQVQVYWRCSALVEMPETVAVDLQVSVQTDRLDSDAAQVATSSLPVGEVLRLVDSSAARFAPIEPSAVSISAADGPGCLLFRPAKLGISYAEMIHASDFTEDRLAWRGAEITVEHRLFAMRLEKGVILRARVRGLFMPRAGDELAAAAAYRDLLRAELPLTT